jgi:acetoin utilization protein AcuB
MLVCDCMTHHPIMVPPSMPLSEAQQLMAENNIRHLPVVEDGKRLVGLLTRESFALKPDMLASLNVWEITRALAGVTARQAMIKGPQVKIVTANRTVERAAGIMLDNKVGCLPVVEDEAGKVVVGIVTAVDMLRSLQEMLGLPDTGVRVTIRMQNKTGEFARLMGVLAAQGWGVMGIGTFPARKDPTMYNAVLKISDVDPEEVRAVFSTVDGQEIVDLRTVD